MYRIGNSKEPSLEQLRKMASNLSHKFDRYCSIQIDTARSHKSQIEYRRFWIYLDNTDITIEESSSTTWPEALAYYRKIMKGGL